MCPSRGLVVVRRLTLAWSTPGQRARGKGHMRARGLSESGAWLFAARQNMAASLGADDAMMVCTHRRPHDVHAVRCATGRTERGVDRDRTRDRKGAGLRGECAGVFKQASRLRDDAYHTLPQSTGDQVKDLSQSPWHRTVTRSRRPYFYVLHFYFTKLQDCCPFIQGSE